MVLWDQLIINYLLQVAEILITLFQDFSNLYTDQKKKMKVFSWASRDVKISDLLGFGYGMDLDSFLKMPISILFVIYLKSPLAHIISFISFIVFYQHYF